MLHLGKDDASETKERLSEFHFRISQAFGARRTEVSNAAADNY